MKLIGYELLKIFTKKMIILLIPLLFVLNGYLYVKEQMDANAYLIQHRDEYYSFEKPFAAEPFEQSLEKIRSFKEQLGRFSALLYAARDPENPMLRSQVADIQKNDPLLIEAFNRSPYADDAELLRRDQYFSEIVFSQYQAIADYRPYLLGMQQKADKLLSVSIFQNEHSFSYRNIMKTPRDFVHLQEIPLHAGLDNGILSGTRFVITDLMLAILIFLLCVYLFLHEKETGLIRLLRTNKQGRGALIAAKLCALTFVTAMLAVVFYGSILWLADRLYGFGDVSRYVQSMGAFRHASLLLTVKQYLYAFVAGKALACLLLSFIFAVFFVLLDHASKIYVYVTALIGGSYIAYAFIHPFSYANIVKYINLFAFYHTFELLGDYKNINVFGFPYQHLWISAITAAVLLIGLPVLAVLLYVKRYIEHSRAVFAGGWNWLKSKLLRPSRSIHIFNHELFKMLVTGKGYLVVLIAIALGYSSIDIQEIRFNEDDAMYNRYTSIVSGEMNGANLSFIEAEKRKFDSLPDEYASAQAGYQSGKLTLLEYNDTISQLKLFELQRKAFERLYKQSRYLIELQREQEITGSFVNELSSNYIFNNPKRDLLNGLSFTVLLLLCVCTLFPMDYRNSMIALLRCSRRGRWTLFAYKHAVGYLIAGVFMLILYAPPVINLLRGYPALDWNAPIQSVELFRHVDLHIRIWEFVLLTHVLQLLGILLMTQCAVCLTLLVKKQAVAILLTSAFLVSPLLIQFTGMAFVRKFSFNNLFLLSTEFAQNGLIRSVALYFTVLAVISVCAGFISWHTYNDRLRISGGSAR
ncbi:hypothetical protein B5M42_008135 [Paenibacillus athensensis]|uniref:Uncharacterized protein n=1 Tax=Paenibacillus athensensis TaxID=1967502 RepID=A0A4Y8PSF8_9BACL|nr:hypothetical protein [Paenibacillus athensensis]MCD1258803.1 hypothetical protein [Paenibacillus athensensis]